MTKISIIIPMLNEAENIKNLLEHLLEKSTPQNIAEIIVADGGSTDGSQKIVTNFGAVFTERSPIDSDCAPPDIYLINSEKGRAKQMNLGAKAASGDLLYFLHADSFPPKNFDQLLLNEVEKGNLAGCFRLQFKSNHWWLGIASWFTKFNWKACRGGDQSQFITRTLFSEIGGYDETFTIYEDYILINALYTRKEFVVINKKIQTSARLYEIHGVWKLQYHFWMIYIKKWFGASAEDLYKYYNNYINVKK
ncbi:glycosyltransferase [Lacinutrix sp. WUR7]|uniref:TIGR04283 family arsenosugar biosynthesis glycosyltransferase n=1 Tax=Lacinutrix sp. WUR7 TaxID=2653681 RepID=UPI00193CD740|nr:TIGR04283 family arsenosugar biosynthesis glycosyltransferase [Lacinutrix sp. WUR7]QRM88253.1 glycosyltransferase [Lacinutrix sp. WUR7]